MNKEQMERKIIQLETKIELLEDELLKHLIDHEKHRIK